MENPTLFFRDDLQISPGNYNMSVVDGVVQVPQALAACFSNNVASLGELYSALTCFPSAVMGVLGWTLDQVNQANAGLRQISESYLPASLFVPPHRTYGLGARWPGEDIYQEPADI